jgi:hypothetical protein
MFARAWEQQCTDWDKFDARRSHWLDLAFVRRSAPSAEGWMVRGPLWPLMVVSALAATWLWRTDFVGRRRPGLCPSCGYDRRGLDAAGPCPECGAVAA